MIIKHTFTLFCVTIFLALFMVVCADTSGGGDGGETEYTGPFEASNVSARQCTSSLSTLNCFISVWNTENSGGNASATNEVKLPLVSGGTYDFYVNWGDGEDVEKIEAYDAPEVTHEYATPGEYTVHIAGTIKGWSFFASFDNYGDATKLLNVEQWGSLSLGNTAGSQFYNASNFNAAATDAPNLSETTSLYAAFSGASNFNGAIGNWDVAKVTDMSYMFASATNFNQDISGWNVLQVKNTEGMFNFASSFNNNGEPLGWGTNTRNITNMQQMFSSASAFNQDISGWKVENVMAYVSFATGSGLILEHIPFKFRDPSTVSKQNCASNPLLRCFISVWNTKNESLGASASDTIVLPLVSDGTYDFYVDWGDETDVQQITELNANEITHTYDAEDAEGEKTIYIAGEIKGWRFFFDFTDQGDAAKLTDVKQWGSLSLGNTAGRQFYNAKNFNPTATDAPDLRETTDLMSAFESATIFNGKIGNWNVSKVGKMAGMLHGASAFNQDISGWNVGAVTNMNSMFSTSSSFNNAGKALTWASKTGKVTDMGYMFFEAKAFNQDISAWDVGAVTNMDSMFSTASSFNNAGKALNWASKTGKVTAMPHMFFKAKVFNQDISDWDVGEVTNMNGMFKESTDFNNGGKPLTWENKTTKVTNVASMFHDASSFDNSNKPLDWNVGNVGSEDNKRSLFATGSKLNNAHNPFHDSFQPQVD